MCDDFSKKYAACQDEKTACICFDRRRAELLRHIAQNDGEKHHEATEAREGAGKAEDACFPSGEGEEKKSQGHACDAWFVRQGGAFRSGSFYEIN